jgi:hypothetical protein
MSHTRRAALVAGLALITSTEAGAVRDPTPITPPRLELVVIEVQNCNICPLVRQQLLPRWQETAWGRTVPMRFVDASTREEGAIGLTSALEIVPTIVLLRDGREIERVTGYLGPSTFIEVMSSVLRREGFSE